MLSPPNLPGSRQQNMARQTESKGIETRKMIGMQGQDPVQITGQNKQHFMQDAIERKIEKFSSQNQSSAGTKYRNQAMNSISSGQGTSASHGPGTSGSAPVTGMNTASKKGKHPNGGFSELHSLADSTNFEEYIPQGQVKRPNTNASNKLSQI